MVELSAFDGLSALSVGKQHKLKNPVKLAVFQGSAKNKIEKYLKDRVPAWALQNWLNSESSLASFDG